MMVPRFPVPRFQTSRCAYAYMFSLVSRIDHASITQIIGCQDCSPKGATSFPD